LSAAHVPAIKCTGFSCPPNVLVFSSERQREPDGRPSAFVCSKTLLGGTGEFPSIELRRRRPDYSDARGSPALNLERWWRC
jgi:hypothetical protein